MTKRQSTLPAHAGLTLVGMIYGANYFLVKQVFNENHSALAVLAIRCLFGTLLFWIIYRAFFYEKIRERKDYYRLALCALFGVSINMTFFLSGIERTSEVHASVLMVTTPLFVLLAALILKQETFGVRKIVGLGISFVGAIALIVRGADTIQQHESDILGDLFITINAASYGLYLVLLRPLILKYKTITIITWVFTFGSIPNILIGLPDLTQMDFAGMSMEAAGGIVYLVIFTTLVAYFINGWAMNRVPSSAVGVYIYLQPVFVAILAVILQVTDINVEKLMYIILIFIGVYIVNVRGRPARKS